MKDFWQSNIDLGKVKLCSFFLVSSIHFDIYFLLIFLSPFTINAERLTWNSDIKKVATVV